MLLGGNMSRAIEMALWALLISASYCDLSHQKIPNILTVPFLVLGLVGQSFLHGIQGLTQSGLAVGAAFILFFPLFATKIFSAGDVKLLMAAGSFLNTVTTIRLGLISIVVGAAVGLFVLITERGTTMALMQIKGHLSLEPKTRSTQIPFAPAVFCAFLLMRIGEVLAWI